MTFGPSYFDAFATFPNARYIFDIPLAYQNHSNSLLFSDAAYRSIGPEKIFALELGNEVNLYRGNVRPGDWSPSDYVSQWSRWTDDIDTRLNVTNNTKLWQAAATSAKTVNMFLPGYNPDDPFKIPNTFEKGGLRKDDPRIKST